MSYKNVVDTIDQLIEMTTGLIRDLNSEEPDLDQINKKMAQRQDGIDNLAEQVGALDDQEKQALAEQYDTLMSENETLMGAIEESKKVNTGRTQTAKEDLKAHRSYHKAKNADNSLYIRKGLEG